jgi:alpha-1,3-fucosyltransferase
MFRFAHKMFKKVYYFLAILIVIFIIYSLKIEKTQKIFSNFNTNNNNSSCNVFTNKLNEKFKIDNKWYPSFVPSIYNKSLDLTCLNSKSKKLKTILLWNKFNGLPFLPVMYGIKKPFEQLNCPVTNCELTNDRSRFSDSSFVLFHLRNKIDYFPNELRPKDQRWIHVIYESPLHCHLCDSYENIFNLTASYKHESDFSSLFWLDSGLYWDLNYSKYSQNNDIFSNKTKLIGTLISNCNDPIGRMNYINELKQYISVDVYGKCGIECPDGHSKWYSNDCREFISKNYKFYILFENSFCNGYVTEKFFNALRYDIIPVVLGAGDYSYYIPKSGYINAMDFKTPEKLANYLYYLSNNKTEYNNFFNWKKYINFETNPSKMGILCEMCIQLHLEDQVEYVNKKRVDVKELYNLNRNCYGLKKENKSFKYELGKNVNYAYWMSPE